MSQFFDTGTVANAHRMQRAAWTLREALPDSIADTTCYALGRSIIWSAFGGSLSMGGFHLPGELLRHGDTHRRCLVCHYDGPDNSLGPGCVVCECGEQVRPQHWGRHLAFGLAAPFADAKPTP